MASPRTALAALALVAALSGCSGAAAPTTTTEPSADTNPPGSAALTPSPVPSTTGRIVSWVGATPTPYIAPTPAPVPPGTPPCAAGGVSASVGWQGATGSMVGWLGISNTTSAPCYLSGPPRLVRLRDGDLVLDVQFHAKASSDDGVLGAAPSALLPPGGAAGSFLVWSNLCSAMRPVVTAVLVTLPGSGGVVSASAAGPGFEGLPRCDVPGSPSTLTAFAFAPGQPNAPAPEPQAAEVSLAAPPTIAAGGLLHYLVTLTNVGSAPAPLDPCPSFTEDLIVGGAALKPPGPQQFLLPCADLGRALGAGASVTMAMTYSVPASVAPGQVQLRWGMDPGGPLDPISASARAWLTITQG